jgi:hypothetical protein
VDVGTGVLVGLGVDVTVGEADGDGVLLGAGAGVVVAEDVAAAGCESSLRDLSNSMPVVQEASRIQNKDITTMVLLNLLFLFIPATISHFPESSTVNNP